MSLTRNRDGAALVTLTSRVSADIRSRLKTRASQSGRTASAAVAELLEFALELEERLKPFQPAIKRLVDEDHMTVPDAVAWLLWMDVVQAQHDRAD